MHIKSICEFKITWILYCYFSKSSVNRRFSADGQFFNDSLSR